MGLKVVEKRIGKNGDICESFTYIVTHRRAANKIIKREVEILKKLGWGILYSSDNTTILFGIDGRDSEERCTFTIEKLGTLKQNLLGGNRVAKKGINSKVKGNRNELALSHWLSAWTGLDFKRVPSSGGLGWKDSVQTVGDVVCVTKGADFPFTIETKHLKTLGLGKGSLLRNNSKVFTIWEQCEIEGKAANKVPLFFGRSNGMKANAWWVFMGEDLAFNIKATHHMINFKYKGFKEDLVLYGMHSDDFKNFDYKQLYELVKIFSK